jgi:hypothetical protein
VSIHHSFYTLEKTPNKIYCYKIKKTMPLLCDKRKKLRCHHVVGSGMPHYTVQTGDGIIDSLLPILKGGVRAVGSLLAKSGAQDLLKRTVSSLLQTGKDQAKRVVSESLPKLAQKGADLAKDAIVAKIEGREPAVNISDEIRKQIESEVRKQAATSKKAFQSVLDPAKIEARQVLKGVIDNSAKETERQAKQARARLNNLLAGNGLYLPSQTGTGLRLL